jgi:hypothetical protein
MGGVTSRSGAAAKRGRAVARYEGVNWPLLGQAWPCARKRRSWPAGPGRDAQLDFGPRPDRN